MELTINRDELAKGLALVGRAVATRSPVPVLSNILLAATPNGLTLAATNLELGLQTRVPATVMAAGKTTLPGKFATELMTNFPKSETINLTLDPATETTRVQCGRYRASVKGISADEFPDFPAPKDAAVASLDGTALRNALGLVTFAAAKDGVRPVLSGVHFGLADGRLTLAAADGFRLSVREIDVAGCDRLDCIIPAKALTELGKVLGDTDADQRQTTLWQTPGQLVVDVGPTRLAVRLLDGTFPDFRQIVPTSHTTRVVLSRVALAAAVQVADLFARHAGEIVRLAVADHRVTLAAAAADVGEQQTTLETTLEGEPVTVGLSAVYLHDVLAALTTDAVALELQGADAPCVVRGVGLEGFTHVIMPMHLRS